MRKFILLFAMTGIALHGQPVVSNLVIDDADSNGGHSSFRVTWNTDGVPDNQRVDWGPTSSYTRTVYTYNPYYAAVGQEMTVSGLLAGVDMDGSRVVHFRACSHNGGGWGCSADQTVTIGAVPATHPVVAARPATFSIAAPTEAGCTVQTVASDLSDLQAKINSAGANQHTVCQVIIIPAGAVGTLYGIVPYASEADMISSINSGTNVLTLGSSNSTYANGDRVRVANNIDTTATTPTGLQEGADYCVSARSGSTLQLTAWPSCTGTVSLGSAGIGQFNIMPFPPRSSNWVTVRSNGSYPPEGVRTGPGWQAASNTARWIPGKYGGGMGLGTNENISAALRFGTFAHHWYIGPGVDFTDTNSNQTDTTDPAPWSYRLVSRASNSYIAFKRNWITGSGYPERQIGPMKFEGSYVDFADNYLARIDYWRPVQSGFATTFAGARLSIASGAYNTGIGNCPSANASSVTLTSSNSGMAYVTLRPSDCAVIVTIPSGTTAACTGCTIAVGADWPRNANNQYSHGLIAECSFGSTGWAWCTQFDDSSNLISQYAAGEIQSITSYGPGPIRYANNYEESVGIFWHIDDSGGNSNLVVPSDIVAQRNVFATLAKYRYGSSASDGFHYPNRNALECKRCSRLLVTGNEFFGGFRYTNDGPSILINSNVAFCNATPCISLTGDTTITSNYIHDAAGGIQFGGGPPGSGFVPNLRRRYVVSNNLVANIAGYTYTAADRSAAPGGCLNLSHGGEDVIVDHNTCYSIAGQTSSGLAVISKMVEGFRFTNNILFTNEDGGHQSMIIDWGGSGTGTPNCFLLVGKTGLDCVTNNVYVMSKNLLMNGYSDSSTTPFSGEPDNSSYNTAWAGTGSYLRSESTVGARLAAAKWSNPGRYNFRFAQSSPYVSGGGSAATDGTDVGVNQDVLEDALGWVKNVRTLSITATGFSVKFHAPDPSAACYVGYGTGADASGWAISAADTSSAQERSISVAGLAGKTAYNVQVWCSQTSASSTVVVRTL